MARANPPFALQAARLHRDLRRDGVAVADMRRAPALELQFAGAGESGQRAPEAGGGVEPLEGPFDVRPVVPCAPSATRFEYFLDGAQKTLLFGRVGPVPVGVAISAAGIVRREPCGRCALAPGTLRMDHAWIAPRGAGIPELDDLLARIDDRGWSVVDPLADPGEDAPVPADAALADYGFMLEGIYRAAREIRDASEQQLLADFWNPQRQAGSAWILADGRLRRPLRNAAGLVKQFTKTYLSGPDAATLLALEPGWRTTAFHPVDRRRGGPSPEKRTLWYLRLWNADGQDARHSLVRVEVDASVRTTAEIDAISSWLLAERTPRATGDQRWATLLYPVHQLERILKRLLEGQCRGWTSI